MSGISYSTVAGRYGITAHANQDHVSQSRSARDILILKRDGTYSVYFATSRSLGAVDLDAADLTGTYTIATDGTLLLTSLDWGDSMVGYVREDESIVLASAADNASTQERWLARRIVCIWPNCRSCRGYLWHYCVRASG